MPKYVLINGTHSGSDKNGKRVRFKKGDVVELTAEQAKNFEGKFKSVEVVKAEAKVVAAQAKELENEQKTPTTPANPQTQPPATNPNPNENKDNKDNGKSGEDDNK